MINPYKFLTFIFLITLFTGNAQNNPQKAKKLLKEALAYIKSDEIDGALPILEEAYENEQNNPELNYQFGVVLVMLKHEIRAIKPLESAKAANYSNPDLEYYLGVAYHVNHKFDKAEASLNKFKANAGEPSEETSFKIQDANRRIEMCKNGKELIKTPEKVIIKNLGPKINTKYPEYTPVISADEYTLLFISRHENTTGGQKDKDNNNHFMEDIYISTKETDTTWSAPKHVSTAINTEDHEGVAGLSPDGQKMFIYKSVKSTHKSGDLYYSLLKGNEWSKPISMGPNVNSPDFEPSISVTSDEKMIFFTSNRKGGFGGTDIYVSKLLPTGVYGPARNLGSKINTKYDEDAPFIHADGKTLYFSSQGHNSMGGYDIFYCTINPETGDIITEPSNIGYPINTADDDIFFVWSADGKRAYFSSEREGGYGDKDIYVLERDQSDAKLVVLKGVILSKESEEPIAGSITVVDIATQQIVGIYNSNSSSGKYTVILPAGKNYAVSVEAPHYLFYSKNIDIPQLNEYREFKDTIKLEPIKVGSSIVLRNVFFDYNKASLRPESESELARVVKIMKLNPTLKIQIAGHTDSDGNDDYNLKLSENRSKSVVDYLVTKGVAITRLTNKGFGETVPIAPNDTPENKQLNRRTEFKIINE